MLKRHEVEIILKAGHAKTEVARLAGVSLCSVPEHHGQGRPHRECQTFDFGPNESFRDKGYPCRWSD
jgi:hypothetical protein